MKNAIALCQECDALSQEDEKCLDKRWVLSVETQACMWTSPDAFPIVDISDAQVLAYHCSEAHAMESVQNYLRDAGARVSWADVRPVETCACCGEDFDASKWHKTLSLTVEAGRFDDPDVLDASYPARFCNRCVPVYVSREPA